MKICSCLRGRIFHLCLGIAVFATLFISLSVSARDSSEDSDRFAAEAVDRYSRRIGVTLSEISQSQKVCRDCDLFAAGRSNEGSQSCRERYKKFFKLQRSQGNSSPEDTEIDIRLAFGYRDNLDEVDDRYMDIAFRSQLLEPCRYRSVFACGFEQDPDDATHLVKTLKLMGADGRLRVRHVNIYSRHSSVTSSERENRGSSSEEQRAQTKSMQEFFVDGLKNADMVLYIGHARFGGGPDFGPPVVDPKTRRTNADWYIKNHPGWSEMIGALRSTGKRPQILGMYACDANTHFRSGLKQVAPEMGLVLTQLEESEASIAQAMATIDSVLGNRCEKDFAAAVNVLKTIDTAIDHKGEFPVLPATIDGVFQPTSVFEAGESAGVKSDIDGEEEGRAPAPREPPQPSRHRNRPQPAPQVPQGPSLPGFPDFELPLPSWLLGE